jgi:hypothetical protein
MEMHDVPFGVISARFLIHSTTSYGSYSGAVPNEKNYLGKTRYSNPKFIIESDAQ